MCMWFLQCQVCMCVCVEICYLCELFIHKLVVFHVASSSPSGAVNPKIIATRACSHPQPHSQEATTFDAVMVGKFWGLCQATLIACLQQICVLGRRGFCTVALNYPPLWRFLSCHNALKVSFFSKVGGDCSLPNPNWVRYPNSLAGLSSAPGILARVYTHAHTHHHKSFPVLLLVDLLQKKALCHTPPDRARSRCRLKFGGPALITT